MHYIQKILLSRLVLQNDQKYAWLTRGYDFENNIVFHLKKLITSGFMEKINSKYKITALGLKEIYALGLPDLANPEKKTFFCGFVISDETKNYLVKGHPTARINFFNLPSDRPRFGEDMEKSLTRIFFENTKLKLPFNRFKFLCLHNKIVKTSKGEILFDDGQAIFEVRISNYEKEKMRLIKEISWYSKTEIEKLPNCWPEIKMCILDKNIAPYSSYEIVSDYKL